MARINNESYVTLATNDSYVMGALTLAQSLKNVNTNRTLSILITNDVSPNMQARVREVFDHVEVVNVLDSNDSINLSLLNRPDLGITFTKLHCWRLTNFSKCVFLDADCLVTQNIDDLFQREEFSAAADVGWPDCFNTGVFVYRPSLETYSNLLAFAMTFGSFDGGDQGLLNAYFSSWSTADSSRRIPFVYNMTTNVSYTYAPAYKNFKDTIKVVHFIGANKPWKQTFNLDTNSIEGNGTPYESHQLSQWWSVFTRDCLPYIDEETVRSTLKIIKIIKNVEHVAVHETVPSQPTFSASSSYVEPVSYVTGQVSADGVVIGSELHQNLWQSGNIEYTGRDSFSNIQAHLDAQLQNK